jgi:hypothetical protein
MNATGKTGGAESVEADVTDIGATELPFETEQLRAELKKFLSQPFELPDGQTIRLGSVKWGVYAFFDYDGEPIYVGQTKESLGTRVRRHLTNQRTDAVAMNVLDPFEVHEIEVWPLPQFQRSDAAKDKAALAHLNALEHGVFVALLQRSQFQAVLNEKDPPAPQAPAPIPPSLRGRVVSEQVSRLRDHPDLRIARRAATLAKLAQVISERKVQRGLRRTLLAQAKRLQALAQRRHDHAIDAEDDDDS